MEGLLTICVVCGDPCRGHKHFSAGWVCRGCVDSSTEIFTVFEIGGVTFREVLKSTRAAGTAQVKAKKG